ncbi:hypothetical protein [Methanolobus psychrotolerans]|uniref:hypothetical protein n=1 Tax=Methanolobus psychrotolerans TaxID=1874706 RepID=UPI0013EA8ED9|nr:hypothetical protein [Methanolobus psychrotolerans]
MEGEERKVYSKAVLFLRERFVRITEDENAQKINTYFNRKKIQSLRTYNKEE